MRHLVEYVNDEVEESLSWEDYHEDYQEDYHEDPVLQTARAGHMQLLVSQVTYATIYVYPWYSVAIKIRTSQGCEKSNIILIAMPMLYTQ